jgi:hypothetical protein
MHNSVTLSNDIQFFGGQAGGQAISDALFGITNPGGRVPLSVPYNVGTLPISYKQVIVSRRRQSESLMLD